MVAIGKHGLGADNMKIGSGEETDVAVGADSHESGSLDLTMRGFDDADATEAVRQSFFDMKFHELYYNIEKPLRKGAVQR